jgi:hypothetical protein
LKIKITTFFVNLFFVKYFVDKEFNKGLAELNRELSADFGKNRDPRKALKLPQQGMSEDNIRKRIMEWLKK